MRFPLVSFTLLLLLVRPMLAPAWETRLGAPGEEGAAWRVAFDSAGNVVAGGYTQLSGDLAVATVVKLDPEGAVLWRTDVDPLGSQIEAVYVGAGGNVLVQGYAGGVDEDSRGHPTVVALSATTGVERWRHEGLDEDGASLVVDAAGDAVLSLQRNVSGTLDETQMLCRKLSGSDGRQLWENPDCGLVGAVDAAGDVFSITLDAMRKISGADGHVMWQGPSGAGAILRNGHALIAVDGAGNVVGARGRRVVKLTGANGALVWQRSVARLDGSIGSIADVTTDANDDVVIAGASAYVPNKGNRLFVAKLAGEQGNQRWRRLVDAKNRDYRTAIDVAEAVAVDGQGNVVLTGELDRGLGLGALVVMKLKSNGRILWQRYPEGLGGYGRDIAVGPGDVIAVAGGLAPPEGVDAGDFYVGSLSSTDDH